jgi:serine/threonine protein kinase
VQKRDAHVPTNPDYAGSHNHVELPPANLQLDPALDASGSKSITLGVEKGQGTTWALAGSVDKNVTRFTKEFQSDEDPSVLAEGKQQWGETVHFWDGSRQHGGSADDVSEGHHGGNENCKNANWSGDVAREDDNDLNGCFDEHGSNLEGLREAAGCNQINGTEDWNFAVETRWYRPPDVYDSYVKHVGQNDNIDGERRTGIGSQVLIGEPESGMPSRLNRSDMGYDFRFHETGVHSQQKGIDSTSSSEIGDQNSELSPFVGTLWYKAPELLYGARKYGKALDMWAVGCIFAELLGGKPLFPGITDIDQLSRVVRVLGAPNEKVWPGISQLRDFDKISFHDERAPLPFRKLLPHASPSSLRFLKKFLVYDPAQRLSAEAALGDSYFQEDPLPLPSTLKELPFLTSRRDSSASEDWAEWRDPGSPFSDFEILDSAP